MAEELQTYLLEHFQWLHRHPELALKEYETTNYVKNVLKQTEGVELLNLGLDTGALAKIEGCLLYTSPSPRDVEESRMPSSA